MLSLIQITVPNIIISLEVVKYTPGNPYVYGLGVKRR